MHNTLDKSIVNVMHMEPTRGTISALTRKVKFSLIRIKDVDLVSSLQW